MALSLTQLYELMKNPLFVVKHGFGVEENGLRIYTTRMRFVVCGLGEITIGTAYFVGQKYAFPVMFLTREQVEYLRRHGVKLLVRKRKKPNKNQEVYLCFPDKRLIESIELLAKPS